MNHFPNTATAFIEIAINRYLHLDPEAGSRLQALQGKVIKIEVREIGLPLYFKISGTGVEVLHTYEDEIHTSMQAPIVTLMRMAVTSDGDESIVGEQIEMSGNMEIGRQFQAVLKNVDIDWEELLSKYAGDIIAHQIGNRVRSLVKWSSNTTAILGRDVTEYLQEETQQLPSHAEITQYIDSVDDVRLAVDRVEARIKLLGDTILNQSSLGSKESET